MTWYMYHPQQARQTLKRERWEREREMAAGVSCRGALHVYAHAPYPPDLVWPAWERGVCNTRGSFHADILGDLQDGLVGWVTESHPPCHMTMPSMHALHW